MIFGDLETQLWTDTCWLTKQLVKLRRGWCRLSKGTGFSLSTSVTTELCDRIWHHKYCYNPSSSSSSPDIVGLCLMSQIPPLVWCLSVGLSHTTGQRPLSSLLLIYHPGCMLDSDIPVLPLAVCPHRYLELKSSHPTSNLPVFANVNFSGSSAYPVLPTSSSPMGNCFSPPPLSQ